MDQAQVKKFTDWVNFALIERLVLMRELVEPVSGQQSSLEENQSNLKRWLSKAGPDVAKIIGAHTGDPALVALYADAAEEMTQRMCERVDQIAAEIAGAQS